MISCLTFEMSRTTSSAVGASRWIQVRPCARSSARRGSGRGATSLAGGRGLGRLMRGRLGTGTEGVVDSHLQDSPFYPQSLARNPGGTGARHEAELPRDRAEGHVPPEQVLRRQVRDERVLDGSVQALADAEEGDHAAE